MNRSAPVLTQAFLLFGLYSCVGCTSGTATYPVEGKVIYKSKELSNAVVTFHPKDANPITAIRPTGLTDENGVFTLAIGKDSGAPPGDYTVTFIWLKEVPVSKEKKGMSMDAVKETFDGFNGAFSDFSKSKHKITIKPEATKLEPFRLE